MTLVGADSFKEHVVGAASACPDCASPLHGSSFRDVTPALPCLDAVKNRA
jgi:hypothetical protein